MTDIECAAFRIGTELDTVCIYSICCVESRQFRPTTSPCSAAHLPTENVSKPVDNLLMVAVPRCFHREFLYCAESRQVIGAEKFAEPIACAARRRSFGVGMAKGIGAMPVPDRHTAGGGGERDWVPSCGQLPYTSAPLTINKRSAVEIPVVICRIRDAARSTWHDKAGSTIRSRTRARESALAQAILEWFAVPWGRTRNGKGT